LVVEQHIVKPVGWVFLFALGINWVSNWICAYILSRSYFFKNLNNLKFQLSIIGHNLGRISVQDVFKKIKSIILSYMEDVVVKISVRIRELINTK